MIRELDITELEKVIHLGKMFAEKKGIIFDPIWFTELWVGLLKAQVGIILGLFDADKCNGALCGVLHRDAVTGEPVALEIHWYVDPDSRGSGVLLYGEFEKWAKLRGCKKIQMGRLIGSPISVEKFYLRRGYSPKEVTYEKEL